MGISPRNTTSALEGNDHPTDLGSEENDIHSESETEFQPSDREAFLNNGAEHSFVQMQRFASVDFLRGLAIVMMLMVHVVSDTLDILRYQENLETGPAINTLALVVFPYLGGLAGLFLMVSAMGNMVAMRRNLERYRPMAIAKKQVTGGLLIVLFAMVLESFVGNLGSLGQVARNLHRLSDNGKSWNIGVWRYQGYHIETIHTIGWSTILNGITQACISSYIDLKRDGHRIITIYWKLVFLVLFATPFVWELVTFVIPGYPWAIDPATGHPIYRVTFGKSPWYDCLLYFLINPLAAPVEPILPYLATSFLGSIIAIHMTEPRSTFDRKFVRRIFKLGVSMYLVGLVGLFLVLARMADVDAMVGRYKEIYDHRAWTAEHGVPGGWFWQWTTLNGASLMIVTVFIRLAEYRGERHAEQFAKNTSFFRRFGFLAFTVYIIQWIYWLMFALVSTLSISHPYERVAWSGSWMTLALTLVAFHFLLSSWSKCGYIGSIEWALVTVANQLNTVRKQNVSGQIQQHWWQQGRLNVEGAFDNVAWIGYEVEEGDDERLLNQLTWSGFLFFPFSIIALRHVRDLALHDPGRNLEKFRIRSVVGLTFFATWFTVLSLVSLNDILGVSK